MANTPEGTPYVESSDLVANYPAASLALANRVDLVGVLPFANAAARTTAIPTPTDGQYSYLQDTNATEFYNGAAWVAAGVAPGLVHINTTTFSAVSSVSVDSVFSSTYANYLTVINFDNSNSARIGVRMRVGGTDATGSNYVTQIQFTTASVTASNETNTYGYFGYGYSSQTPKFIIAEFLSPNIAEKTGIYSRARSGTEMIMSATGHDLSTSYDGLTVLPIAGTITGTIRIYGYKNS